MTDLAPMQAAAIDARIARRRRTLIASLVITALTTLVTGLAHAVGGGAAPDTLLIATAFVVTLLVLAPVLRGRRSVARQTAAVTVGQLLQHTLYALPDTAASAPSVGAHAHGGGDALASAALHAHSSMPLAHAGAGLLTLAMLRWVPRVVDAMLQAMSLRHVEAVLTCTLATPQRRAAVVAAHRPSRVALDVLSSACGTRGPPSFAV